MNLYLNIFIIITTNLWKLKLLNETIQKNRWLFMIKSQYFDVLL